MCQCADRRTIIVRAAGGEVRPAEAVAFVARSLAGDARMFASTLASSALAAARARLAARARR